MSRLAQSLARPGHKALIPYLTVGYPSVEATLELVPLLARAGCDAIELGIPFSDPLADGPTIQSASQRALQQGVTPTLCLELARALRGLVSVPLVFMTYYNPVLACGPEAFCAACAEAGVAGLIVPDLPPEEADELAVATLRHGVDLTFLVAPTSSEERLAFVAQRSRGFLYLVAVSGVTGPRESLPADLPAFAARAKRHSKLPVCVGFGIATPQQARQVAQLADGVIVGSRLIQLMGQGEGFAPALGFIRELRAALDDV